MPRYYAWVDTDAGEVPTLDDIADLRRGHGSSPDQAPRRRAPSSSRAGTTGTPKGASRDTTDAAGAALGFVARVPLKIRDTTLVAAPGFHAWGAAHLAAGTGARLDAWSCQRRFDPEAVLAAIDMHRVRTLAVVPVMLQRILDLPEDVRAPLQHVVARSASRRAARRCRATSRSGGWTRSATTSTTPTGRRRCRSCRVADPPQLRATPGTAGTPLRGNTIRLLDDKGNDVAVGETGRIFVGNGALFDGYTGGGTKEIIDGLMSIGDVGHFDDARQPCWSTGATTT